MSLYKRVERAIAPAPMCRDCADRDGRCESGELCDPNDRALEIAQEVQQLEQDNEGLRHDIARQVAISSELATENAEMLELLEESLRFIPFEYYNKKEEIRALITKIESQKEGE